MDNLKEEMTIKRKDVIEIKDNLNSFGDLQRLSSILIWLGILMVIIHLCADLYFHLLE